MKHLVRAKDSGIPLSKVALTQSLGFLAIIAVSWLAELTNLRSLVFGNHPYISDFRESTLEMLVVLGVWFIVTASTRRVLAHARRLEGFMRVCSWCHHINYKDEWIAMEEFLRKGFDTPTTHGICPRCLEKQLVAIEDGSIETPKRKSDLDSLPAAWRSASQETAE